MRVRPCKSVGFAGLLALSVLARSLIVDGYMPAAGGLVLCPSGGLSGLLIPAGDGDDDGPGHQDSRDHHHHHHHHAHAQAEGDAPAPAGDHDHAREHSAWSDCSWQSVPAPAAYTDGDSLASLIGPGSDLHITATPAPFLRHRTGLPPTRAPPLHS